MEEKINGEKDQVLEYTKEVVIRLIESGFASSFGFYADGLNAEETAAAIKSIYDAFAKAAGK